MNFKKKVVVVLSHATHLQLSFAEIVAEKIIFGEHEVELSVRKTDVYILNRGGFFTVIEKKEIASITEDGKEIWDPETESLLGGIFVSEKVVGIPTIFFVLVFFAYFSIS